jgi:hypothetical protein
MFLLVFINIYLLLYPWSGVLASGWKYIGVNLQNKTKFEIDNYIAKMAGI